MKVSRSEASTLAKAGGHQPQPTGGTAVNDMVRRRLPIVLCILLFAAVMPAAFPPLSCMRSKTSASAKLCALKRMWV